jgi:hypothetical protein
MMLKKPFIGLLIASGLFGLAPMPQALAQQQVQPWERDLQKFYNRDRKVLQPRLRNPAQEALRKLRRDPLAKLGLPTNQGVLRQETPKIVEPTFSPFAAGHDRDGDGAVTREEYFSSQRRHFAPVGGSATRRQRALNRLNSQFRNADIDRDGKVTAKELNSLPGVRF